MVPWMLWGTLRSYFHPCLWAPTTHEWNIHCLISAFRGHSPLSPSPAIEHHTGSRGIPAWVPAPPSQEIVFFFSSVSPHPLLAGRASITTVRLEVIEAGDEERAHILSIEKQEKKKKKKTFKRQTPCWTERSKLQKGTKISSLSWCFHYSVKV